jgi:hypothetical protein
MLCHSYREQESLLNNQFQIDINIFIFNNGITLPQIGTIAFLPSNEQNVRHLITNRIAKK